MSTPPLAIAALLAFAAVPQQPVAGRACERFGHPLFGSVVCAPGDADGDGVPDLIVADPCFATDHGTARAWLVSGKTMRVLFTRPLDAGDEDLELAILGLEDVNGDGTKDWLLSPSWFTGHPQPRVSVVSGKDGSVLRELDPEDPGKRLVDRRGRALHAPYFAEAAAAGDSPRLELDDLDGDGVRDCAVGGAERVDLVSGKEGKLIRRLTEPEGHERTDFGAALAGLGDIDGDKLGDIAVASPEWGVAEGRVQVFSSATGKRLYTVEPDEGWHWGRRLAALGDIDGDGACDLAVASWHALSHEPGRARIVSGRNGKTSALFLRAGETLLIASGSPSARVRLPLYSGSGYPLFGNTLASAGDVDRDGHGDFLIADPGSPAGGIPPRAWLVSGKDLRVCATVTLPMRGFDGNLGTGGVLALGTCGDVDRDGRGDWLFGYRFGAGDGRWSTILMSGATFDRLAWKRQDESLPALDAPLADLGDIDGDGRPEELHYHSETPESLPGFEVRSSRGAALYSIQGSSMPAELDLFGEARAIVEDLDGDGVRDFVVGCENRESFAPGRVFVFSGKSGRLLALLGRKGEAIERLPLERK
jgi:hypothetical protein